MSEPNVDPSAAEREPDSVTPEPYMTADEAAELRTLFAGNPVIDHAERQLRTFGVRDGESTDAVKLLLAWPDFDELTGREVRGVAARFVEPDGLTPQQIEDDRQATALDSADDHFHIGPTSSGWPGTDLAPKPDVRHFANLADAFTVCGLERATVRWTDDPATPVDCPECAGKLVDEQLAEPERRTVSLECLTDELRAETKDALTDGARVAAVLRGLPATVVMDTDAEWARQIGDRPLLILSRMLQAMEGWAREAGATLVMPRPDVLAALDGRPDAQLLTAPVHVLAMDVDPGMYLAPLDGPLHLVTETAVKCTTAGCEEGDSCVVFLVDGREQHGSGYARTRVRIPVSVTL